MKETTFISSHIKPSIFLSFKNLIAAQSTRLGGKSIAPYDSLNLGLSTGDIPNTVLQNRQIFFSELGIELNQVALSHQVHSDEILYVEQSGNYSGYDSMITNHKNIFLAISIADCTPILIYDFTHQAVAAVHAGWRGTSKLILHKTLNKMNTLFETTGNNCAAFIGTCISRDSYEVDSDVADNFSDSFKHFDQTRNKFYVDLKAANNDQLMRFGIPENQIEVSSFCTLKNNDLFFSHRYGTLRSNGKSGRMFATIGIK